MNEHTLSHSTNYPSLTTTEVRADDPQKPAATPRHEHLLHETVEAQKISGETNVREKLPAIEALSEKVAEIKNSR